MIRLPKRKKINVLILDCEERDIKEIFKNELENDYNTVKKETGNMLNETVK